LNFGRVLFRYQSAEVSMFRYFSQHVELDRLESGLSFYCAITLLIKHLKIGS